VRIRAERLAAYEAARRTIDVDLVRLTPRRKDHTAKVAAARAFNAALGDPQRAYPSVQVAGTSGKGSVCALIASTLAAAGVRTGLHVSPYLQVFTEKTWIDGRLCSVEELTAALAAVQPLAERVHADPDCPASVHGMTSLAVSYVAFREAGVELAVMETGVGGRYDLVCGLDRALSVITDLGLDHPKALGETIEEVAHHKAGIMERGVPCVAIRGAGWDVLCAEAETVGAELIAVVPEAVIRESDGKRAAFDLPHLGPVEVELACAAPFLLRNAAVAAVALDRLARDGWPVTAAALHAGFLRRVLPGRVEQVQGGVILDGAHNPQKMAALLDGGLPEPPATVVLAASGQRAPSALLARFSRPTRVIACELELYGKSVVPAADLAQAARAQGLAAEVADSPEAALDRALAGSGPVLVTGSLYLLGRLRSRWYPWQDVLLQQTSWPTTQA
jgi:dihydrofolate synthase/folylpolyglutamate synthase